MQSIDSLKTIIDDLQATDVTPTTQDACYQLVLKLRQNWALRPDEYDTAGYTQIHWAVITNQVKDTKRLLEKPQQLNALTKYSPLTNKVCLTPLALAAIYGHTYLASYLIAKNADTTIVSKTVSAKEKRTSCGNSCEHKTAFDEACERKHYEIVRLLIKKEIIYLNQHQMDSAISDPPLFFCIPYGFTREEKLIAAQNLKKAICTSITFEELQHLQDKYPAIKQAPLVKIYEIFLTLKANEENEIYPAYPQPQVFCTLF